MLIIFFDRSSPGTFLKVEEKILFFQRTRVRKIRLPFKTAFIVNPAAGGGRALRTWRKLETLLHDNGQSFQTHYTRWRSDATAIAKKARSMGAELIVAVGGDGTLFEVLNGLDLKKNIFGVIPAGTANGFRRSLGIPADCRRALLEMAGWSPRPVDIGMVNGLRFLNVIGLGFDAAVAQFAKADDQKLPGYAAFVAGFLKELATFKPFHAAMTMNSDKRICEAKTFIAMVANGRYYGGQLCIAPHAAVDDGQLNLVTIRRVGYIETAVLGIRAFMKNHLSHRAVQTAPFRELTIDANELIPMHVDGELIGSPPARVTVQPGVLSILAPSST